MQWTREIVRGSVMVLQYLASRPEDTPSERKWVDIKITWRWVPAHGWVKVD